MIEDLDKISFDYLPEEFKNPFRSGVEISNVESVRDQLEAISYSPNEVALIINLASRIQQKKFFDADKTLVVGTSENLVISDEVLKLAVEGYEKARHGASSR